MLNKDNIALELAVEQLNWIGFEGDPYAEVKREGWYKDNRWESEEQADDFHEYAVSAIQKTMEVSRESAENSWLWWDVSYGLGRPQE